MPAPSLAIDNRPEWVYIFPMTKTKTLTAAEALEMLTNAYPYAHHSMAADAEALAQLAAGPKAAEFFRLAAEAVSMNTLAFRRFMIEHGYSVGLSGARWRSMADNLAKALGAFTCPILPTDLARPMADFGPYAYVEARKTLKAMAAEEFNRQRNFDFGRFYRAMAVAYPVGTMGRYVADLEAADVALDELEADEYRRHGI